MVTLNGQTSHYSCTFSGAVWHCIHDTHHCSPRGGGRFICKLCVAVMAKIEVLLSIIATASLPDALCISCLFTVGQTSVFLPLCIKLSHMTSPMLQYLFLSVALLSLCTCKRHLYLKQIIIWIQFHIFTNHLHIWDMKYFIVKNSNHVRQPCDTNKWCLIFHRMWCWMYS